MKHPYRAPVWLPGGHLQTLYSTLFIRVPPVAYRRERLELADGDFLDFDWVDSTGQAPVVVLFHGLEGSAESSYSRTLMARVQARGWRGVVAHFRGCPGEDNRLPRAYFAGDSADIECMLRHVKNRHPAAPIHAVGVSLGGNALLKWLGERGEAAGALVERAAAVSAPLDLAAAGHALDRGFNRRVYTARCDADDYWLRVSSKPLLKSIALPTLIINARNDPFLPASALPTVNEISSMVMLEQPAGGGHASFPSGPFPGHLDWLPQRLIRHFATQPG